MKQASGLVLLFVLLLAAGFWHAKTAPPANTRVVVPGGAVSFGYTGDFGLAVSPEQILVRSYIPPCDQGFDYCLYYTGSAYKNTSFESAGIRVKRRADLSENNCLTAQPDGYQ